MQESDATLLISQNFGYRDHIFANMYTSSRKCVVQEMGVQRVDDAIQQIKCIGWSTSYLLDCDLAAGESYPLFERPHVFLCPLLTEDDDDDDDDDAGIEFLPFSTFGFWVVLKIKWKIFIKLCSSWPLSLLTRIQTW